jgi:uncharacterized repeat protein (TIGR02543 family)
MSRSSARLLVVLCAAGVLLCAPTVAHGAVNITQKGALGSLVSPVNDGVEYLVGSTAVTNRYTVKLQSGSTISLGLVASSGGGNLYMTAPGPSFAGQCSAAVGVPGAVPGYVASVTGTYTLDIDPTYLMSLPGPTEKYWFAYTLSWTIEGPYETVTFNGNGGTLASASATATTSAALGAKMPANPTRTGFTFAGWNTAANGSGTAFTSATPVAADVTVYAQWTPAYVGPLGTVATIKTNATTTRIGGIAILSGSVAPTGLIGKNMVVYVKKPGSRRWTYSSNRTVYSLGGGAVWQYKYVFKRGMTKGVYYFKAVVPTMTGFTGSESGTISVRLK